MSKPSKNRKQCQAFVSSTQEQCKKSALRGSSYCWHHQSKLPIFVALLVGIITSLLIPKAWEAIFPPKVLQKIEQNTEQIPNLAEDISTALNIIHSSSVDVSLSFTVADPNLRPFNGRIATKVAICHLLTKSGSSLIYRTSPGDVKMTRSKNQYVFQFKTVLSPDDNIYRNNPEEFYHAQKIIIPLSQFVSIIKVDASINSTPILSTVKTQFFVNSIAVDSQEYRVSRPVDETNNVEISLSSIQLQPRP